MSTETTTPKPIETQIAEWSAEREAAEAARIETEKPEREQIAAWAKTWADAEPKHPQIQSPAIKAELERISEDVRRLLNLLAGAEGGGE
jgi:hypothetical protein